MNGPERPIARPAAPALFVVAAALGSVLPSWAHLPILLYAPIERSFRLASIGAPGGPPVEITYYGTYLCAAGFGLAGALVGAAWDRHRASTHPLLPAWTLTAIAIAASYQVWTLWP